jgi:hypothetical protein
MNSGRDLGADFGKFWIGQGISTLGSTFTVFAIPLLIFKLSHSPLNLGVAWATGYLPSIVFGIPVGALVDRLDRKRTMVCIDVMNIGVVLSVPLLGVVGRLPVWWLYVVPFLIATLYIGFNACAFAAIPALVKPEALLAANSRIYATNATATILGPILAGVMVAYTNARLALIVDAASYLVSVITLVAIRVRFNADDRPTLTKKGQLRRDMAGGIRYVLASPLLRSMALMLMAVNFFNAVTWAEIIFLAKTSFHATDREASFFWAASGAGVLGLSLLATRARARLSLRTLIAAALALDGAATFTLGLTSVYPLALVLWALHTGLIVLVSINSNSYRQKVVPNRLLGRVITVSNTLAWAAIPAGALAGGAIASAYGHLGRIYAASGVLVALTGLMFATLTPRSAGGGERSYLAGDPDNDDAWTD